MSLRDRIGALSRRDWFRLSGAGLLTSSFSGWLAPLASHAAEAKRRPQKACILLWMDGGPSHKDTFDLKPGTKDGGEFKPIPTSVPGVQVSEHFPKLAPLMHHASLIRSMSTSEGAHGRAKYFMHTGYREGQGGVTYPSLGALASAELGVDGFPLPNYVVVGNKSHGAGFLGAKHQPLVVGDPSKGVESLNPVVAEKRFAGRLGLLEQMEAGFFKEYQAGASADHRTTYQRAVTLMRSAEAKALDLSLEPASGKSRYGAGKFAESCLLARRLVEVGVPFVEVVLGGWDTHTDVFGRVKSLSQQVDAGLSALLADLKDRGLLDSTLVVWMGDFGRTPKINARGDKPGRDHYPKAWTSLLAGGGIKAGQVVGRTDTEGATVEDRPVSAMDFMATVCTALGIDPAKQNETPGGRPIRIVDKKAQVVSQLV